VGGKPQQGEQLAYEDEGGGLRVGLRLEGWQVAWASRDNDLTMCESFK
jgi:hypothetical protein